MARVKEWLIWSLTIAAGGWGAHMVWEAHKEVTARQLRQPETYPKYSDFLMSLWVFGGLLVAQLLNRPLFSAIARALIPKKARWSHKVWGLKITRCCDGVFKGCYYVGMTLWGFQLLRGESWTPWSLGGHGDTRNGFSDGFPFQLTSVGLRNHYLTAVGHGMSEVAMLLLDAVLHSRHPDFGEMLLHHLCACFLLSLSYILNYQRVGSLVLLLHNASDVFIYMSKVLVDTPNVKLACLSYFALIGSYAWFRVGVLPLFVMRSAWVESVEVVGPDIFGWGFLNFTLCVLLLLHMYWFGLIVKIGFAFRKTGEARDMQANLSSLDLGNVDKKNE